MKTSYSKAILVASILMIGMILLLVIKNAKSQEDLKSISLKRVGKSILPIPLLFPAGTKTTSVSISNEDDQTASVVYFIQTGIAIDKMYAFYRTAYPKATWLNFEKKDLAVSYVSNVKDDAKKVLFTIIIDNPSKVTGALQEGMTTAQISVSIPKDSIVDDNGNTNINLPK